MSDEIPAGLSKRGQEMWSQFLAQDENLSSPDNPNRQVALEAARTADMLELMEQWVRDEPPVMDGRGGLIVNPAYIEIRQQRQTLKQLVAALRLPDEQTGKKPQRRGPRGSYAPAGVVSSLDRARKAASA